jgi:hypothetical protein
MQYLRQMRERQDQDLEKRIQEAVKAQLSKQQDDETKKKIADLERQVRSQKEQQMPMPNPSALLLQAGAMTPLSKSEVAKSYITQAKAFGKCGDLATALHHYRQASALLEGEPLKLKLDEKIQGLSAALAAEGKVPSEISPPSDAKTLVAAKSATAPKGTSGIARKKEHHDKPWMHAYAGPLKDLRNDQNITEDSPKRGRSIKRATTSERVQKV